MTKPELWFISLCKKQIEEKFAFDSQGYTQRDLETLSSHIEKRTGVIISLSTLKRVWKNDFKQSPQLATLNALAVILDHQDWQAFKLAHQKPPHSIKAVVKWAGPVFILLVAAWLAVFGFLSGPENSKINKNYNGVKINGPVYFEALKTLSSGVPNTVVFKYDLSNVEADTFYIQQSWNKDHRMGIDSKGKVVTSIYYESGFHRARLLANDSIIAMQPVHIISNGWEPHMYYSDSDPELIDFKNEKFVSNGQLHLDSSILKKRNIDNSKRFHSRITNSQTFGIDSDNFNISTRMKADSVFDKPCAWMDLIIITEVENFTISLTEKGCEKYAAYKLGEISKQGNNNDLSALGCNVYNWHELELNVKDRHATIYLNGKPLFQELYKKKLGKIMALIYIFDGTGSIDYVKLKDGKGHMVFEDDFESR